MPPCLYINCLLCGADLPPNRGRGKRRKFCSISCGQRWYLAQRVIAMQHYKAFVAAQTGSQIVEATAKPAAAIPSGWDATKMRVQGNQLATPTEIAAAQAPRFGGVGKQKASAAPIVEQRNAEQMDPGTSKRRSHHKA